MTLTFDLWTQKSNQFIIESKLKFVPYSKKSPHKVLETDGRTIQSMPIMSGTVKQNQEEETASTGLERKNNNPETI